MPVIGEIRSFATDEPSAVSAYKRLGWLECDGKSLNQITYAKLFKVIDLRWGTLDKENSFLLPDLRGLFLRGLQRKAEEGRDPDVTTREEIQPGGAVRGRVGSFQDSDFGSHNHVAQSQIFRANGIINNPAGIAAYYGENPGFVAPQTSHVGISETRPKNAYVLYMIFAGIPAIQKLEDGRLAYPESEEFMATELEIENATAVNAVNP